MARYRLCKACGEFHDLDADWPLACLGDADQRRSHLAAPSIRPDGMTAIRSMADGQMYDSRSGYYASVRRAGCEIVGDDRSGFGKRPTADDVVPGNIRGDIKTAIDQLSTGKAA